MKRKKENRVDGQIAIIDYGAGNLRSVANAIKKLGYRPLVTNKPDEVLLAEAIILPGVGAAADTMSGLKKAGIADVIRRLTKDKRPLFAVCIGLQVLLSETEEGGRHHCLDVIPGVVKKLPSGLKVPHMGWNQVKQRVQHWLFDGIDNEADFYFVHSYYAQPEDESLIAALTDYGLDWCSVLIKDNLVATQFHPEKSGRFGLKMYDNFLKRYLGSRS
jgi:glutamine amidotransferase